MADNRLLEFSTSLRQIKSHLVSRLWSRADRECAGGDNNLVPSIAPFTPNVNCAGTVSTTEESCRYIAEEMLKSNKVMVFGTPDVLQPVDVALPLTLKARKHFSTH